MKKSIIVVTLLFFSGFVYSQTTVTLQDQCNCEVLSGTAVSSPGAVAPGGADAGDIYVNTSTGTIFFWDGDSWELTSTDDQQLTGFTFNGATNDLTLTLENGGSVNVDLSSLSDTLTDTNTTITSFGIDGTNTNLVITDSDTNTFSVALADIAALVNTDAQDLEDVIGEDASAGNNAITDLADPTNAQDAATKAYVDATADDDITGVSFDGTSVTVAEGATSFSADISALDDSAGVAANAAAIAAHNTADGDLSDTNEIQDLEDVIGQDASAGNNAITDLADPTNAQDAATKAYVDATADDDITGVSFDGTSVTVAEGATSFSADISALDDSAGVAANAAAIAA
ncbi:hypothetical protein FVB32_00005, partial [Flagellimonas hymeniacidonis]